MSAAPVIRISAVSIEARKNTDVSRSSIGSLKPNHSGELLSAYGAAVDQSAFVTSTVVNVTGTPARSFHDWAVEHAGEFLTSLRRGVTA